MSDAPYWRSLDEFLDPDRGRAGAREFPPGADRPPPGVTRRELARLLGASLALAGVAGCTRPPQERIRPYVREPREHTPGVARSYATAMSLEGYATGLLVESHAGRPTKVEGNPEHPASLGATGAIEQASVLGLYDPDRARLVTHEGRATDWARLAPAVRDLAARHRTDRGAGLRLLLEPTSSPLVAYLLGEVQSRYPEARVHVDEPLAWRSPYEGTRLAFGRPLEALYDFGQADVVLAIDADPLASGPFHLRHARQFAGRRRVAGPSGTMSRLYAVEAPFSLTGAMADHRLPVRSAEAALVLAAVLTEVVLAAGPAGLPADARLPLPRPRTEGPHGAFVRAVARDLRDRAGRGLVVVGPRQPAEAHALGHLLNAVLGNVGRTVSYVEPSRLGAAEPAMGLRPLAEAVAAGAVDTLVILEGNPAYTAPADLDFARRLAAVPSTIRLGLYPDETARVCRWLVPAAHYLEAWGDTRAADGTLSFVQPLIDPLYGGKTPAEVLALFLGADGASAYDLVRDFHRGRVGAADFEAFFEGALARGLVEGSAAAQAGVEPRWAELPAWLDALRAGADAPGLELVLVEDPKVHDGRFANNAWLAELPDPMTRLTWDNAAVMSPATARRLGVETERMVELRYRGRTLAAPALVLPGHADGVVSIALGYGRDVPFATAAGMGVNAYRLRESGVRSPFGSGLDVVPLTETVPNVTPGRPPRERPMRRRLAITQTHWTMDGRPIALSATLAEFRRDPDFTAAHRGPQPSLHPPWPQEGPQWGMTIDLTVCTGCSACVVACQAENNIPTVGKDEVLNSREMHWLRIDRYFTGPAEAPRVVMEPMLCQHCEKAPCEYVCPVYATLHSPDGLNEMIYNRCIGTRFCSNNCPWKVRRFNWFDYNATRPGVETLVMNPDVTVRERGVMEKCTFCVQRIRRAGIEARLDGRETGAEALQTACQQACPTGAIVFGSLADPAAAVSRLRDRPQRFAVLHHLGTRPRVEYLARITNPSEALG